MKLNQTREFFLRRVFRSLLIPRANKHFSDWSVANAFALEHTTLKLRLADEFELLQAPDITTTVMSSKVKESNMTR